MDGERLNRLIDSLIALFAFTGLMFIVIAAVIGIITDPYAWLGAGMLAAGLYAGKKRGWS